MNNPTRVTNLTFCMSGTGALRPLVKLDKLVPPATCTSWHGGEHSGCWHSGHLALQPLGTLAYSWHSGLLSLQPLGTLVSWHFGLLALLLALLSSPPASWSSWQSGLLALLPLLGTSALLGLWLAKLSGSSAKLSGSFWHSGPSWQHSGSSWLVVGEAL